jgi:hypothetical protein
VKGVVVYDYDGVLWDFVFACKKNGNRELAKLNRDVAMGASVVTEFSIF